MNWVQRLAVSGTLALTVVAVLGWHQDEIPAWMLGGTRILGHRPLGDIFDEQSLTLAPGSTVLIIGDSNATSSRIPGALSWPTRLGQALGHDITVRNMSRGGLTANAWLTRYTVPADVDLCIIAFGSNDAASRGWLNERQPVGTSRFVHDISRLIAACRAQFAPQVLVLSALPTGSRAMEHRVAPYRTAAREAAIRAGAAFADPMEAFTGPQPDAPLLGYDALHLTAQAHQRLSIWLASRIRVGLQHTAAKHAARCPRLSH